MEKKYLLAEDTINQQDLNGLSDWLLTNPWLTQGPLVREFETSWANWLGTKYATFVNSGSSANLLMFYALHLSGRLKNNKVIVPAVSWATTVAPAIQLGFEPIMCEADPVHFGLDLKHLESLLKKHNAGSVILVHVLGVPNAMEQLLELKRQYNFMLMEDACAATGSTYDDNKVGTFGDMSSFSYFFGHHMSTIEGGMVCTNDETLHDILLHIRSHGWAKDIDPIKEEAMSKERKINEFNRPFTFYYPGFNVRSSDLNAHIGLSQMNKLEHVVRRRVENHSIYQKRFSEASGFQCQTNDRSVICSISFAALASSLEHRDSVALTLRSHQVETRPLGGGNMSTQPFWSDRHGSTVFPVADRIHATGFQLPNHPSLTPEDINHICDVVLSIDR